MGETGWLRDPRVRALGVVAAVAGAALWIDHESYRGVQQGLAMRREREAREERERQAKRRFIQVDLSHLPQITPLRVDWRRDLVFVEAYGNIYYAKGGRYIYDWYRRFPEWHRYVILDNFPSWKDYL
ncbi:MAG: hypothetical protein QXK52_06775 [Candidatus Bathyarchaeia archaeon]